MRIASISNSRIPSSTANSIQAMKVCDALVQCGHDVRLVIPAETPAMGWQDLARHYGVRHEFQVQRFPSRPPLRRLDFVWSAHRYSAVWGADLVYTWLPQTAALETRLGRPVVLEMHADVAGRFGAWWLRQFCGGHGGRLLVTTKALRRALERSTGMRFLDDMVRIEPNGVDLERYRGLPDPAKARERLGMFNRFTVGFTGHFYKGRGIDLLQKLAQGLPDLSFLWVGGTEEAVTEWKGRLQAAALHNVILTGFVENSELPLYQAAADVLLMPYGRSVAASSGQEISAVINPMKMFEYMAAARPIVTADLPVIREVLDESSAVFCRADDVVPWQEAIMNLVSDARQRAVLAANARRKVETYTWVARAERALQGLV